VACPKIFAIQKRKAHIMSECKTIVIFTSGANSVAAVWHGAKSRHLLVIFMLLSQLVTPGISSAVSLEEKSRMRENCALEAGGKAIDIQSDTMKDCSGQRMDKPMTVGQQQAIHAKIKACDAAANKIDVQNRRNYIRSCITKDAMPK
jgi:hypothetical protein